MTHTVPLDELWRDRRFVNHLNENLRHCRIGRVTEKAKSWPLPFNWFPDPMEQGPMFMGKCGCRVGSACGNAACPHGMVVMCGTTTEPVFYHPV